MHICKEMESFVMIVLHLSWLQVMQEKYAKELQVLTCRESEIWAHDMYEWTM